MYRGNSLAKSYIYVLNLLCAFQSTESRAVVYLNIIYGLAVLLVLSIVGSACFIIYRRYRHQRNRDRLEEPKTAESTGIMGEEVQSAESTGTVGVELETAESLTSAYDNVAMWTVADSENVDGFRRIRDQIKTVRFLGSGNFGQVYQAVYGPLRSEVAVKSLKDDATKKDLKDMLTELDLMKSLKPHPHVVRLIGCCTEKDPIMIVLEYLPYGDLLGYLRKSRGIEDTYNTGEKRPSSTLTEKDLLSFAWMIADGMSYLSTKKVVHRDLAARNVLVGDNKVCKISDFGLARGLEGDIYMRKAKARLPIKWMPPESLLYGTSTTMSDVWSYGIVMWEVFTIGESPYPGRTKSEIAGLLVKGYRMPKLAHISQELYSIMTMCWQEKPQERPTFQWLCSAVKKLLHDRKKHVNLEVYNTKDYVNLDMMAGND